MRKPGSAALMFALIAATAGSVEASELNGPGDETASQIVVVNQSVTPVQVYLEDAEGRLHVLGVVEQGEAKTLEAPSEIADRGDFSVRIRPRGYVQHRRDPVSIKTGELHLQDGATVVLWLQRELDRSTVEIRAG